MSRLKIRSLFVLTFALVAAHAPNGSATTLREAVSAQDDAKLSGPERLKEELARVGVQKFTDRNYKPGLLRHIVLFRYAADVTAAQKQQVKERFLALQKSRRNGKPYIVSIETGGQNSGEGVDNSLEQAFVVTFQSQGDRNFYVGQPLVSNPRYYDANHQTFKNFVGPLLHKEPLGVLVFDFTIEAIAE